MASHATLRSSSANLSPSGENRRRTRRGTESARRGTEVTLANNNNSRSGTGTAGRNRSQRRLVRNATRRAPPDIPAVDESAYDVVDLSDEDELPLNTMTLRRARGMMGLNRLATQRSRPGRSQPSMFTEVLYHNFNAATIGPIGHRSTEARHPSEVILAPPGRSVMLYGSIFVPRIERAFGMNYDSLDDLNFEMAENFADADTGLNTRQIDSFTTQKKFTVSASSSAAASSSDDNNSNESCSICMMDYEAGEDLRILPCIHNFHKACVDIWLNAKPTCPICRIDVRTE